MTAFNMRSTLTVLAVLAAGTAMAGDLPNAKEAAKSLYKTGRNPTIVRVLVPDMVPANYAAALQSAAKVQKFFEAMAASPSEGMLAGSATLAANFHTAEAAHAAAIAGCNAKKAAGSKPCVVIAEFLPKGYRGPGGFSLSFQATEAFGKYKRAKAPKAFAISASTGNWGEAVKAASPEAAAAAAIAECAARAAKHGARDCQVVTAD
ncbi:MAG: hypothetical protein K8F59_13195 [Rhodobacteraceae bacterium]|nr:hypothetical protein [Paracoccaceae bacterium]